MSNDKKQPWGNIVAVIAGVPTGTTGDTNTQYVQMGVAWYNDKDGKQSFALTLDSEPVAWKDPHCKRTLLIQKRQPRNGR